MSKKRRSAGSSATADMVPDPICIIHSPSLSNPGPFTALDNIKSSPAEKLAYLNNVRDRRLAEPLESPYRMQTECQRLPQSLNEINYKKQGTTDTAMHGLPRISIDYSSHLHMKLTPLLTQPSITPQGKEQVLAKSYFHQNAYSVRDWKSNRMEPQKEHTNSLIGIIKIQGGLI